MASSTTSSSKRLRLPTIPRHEEEGILHTAFQNVLDHRSRIQMVLVGGGSGTGKSTLVKRSLASFQAKHHLHHSGSNNNNSSSPLFFHATTKFDQRQTTAPLAGLRQLVTDLIQAAHRQGVCCDVVKNRLTPEQIQVMREFSVDEGVLRGVQFDDNNNNNSNSNQVAVVAAAVVEESKEVDVEPEAPNSVTEESPESAELSEDASDLVSVTVDDFSKDGLAVLTTTLKAYIQAVASVSPVLLQLEGLQWGCRTTMELLECIVTAGHSSVSEDYCMENLCVVATFRTNEETANDHFYAWKDELQAKFFQQNDTESAREDTVTENDIKASDDKDDKVDKSTSDYTIPLSQASSNLHVLDLDNLELSHVQEILAEATSREMSDIEPLADVVFKFTHGNLFFLRHFLEKLQDDGLLVFNDTFFRWEWDVEKIKRRSSISSNVVQVLASRLHKLPQSVQNVLMLAACFGNQFDVRALEIAKTVFDDIKCVEWCLNRAAEQEFVIPLTTSTSGGKHYKFCHDMLQMTAYGLVPEEVELGKVHWDIGCLLLEKGKHLWQTDDSILFSTVDHVNIGVDWLESPTVTSGGACLTKKWRINVAKINYLAGAKAASLSAFYPAATYMKAGIKALGGCEDAAIAFRMCYPLALKMFDLYAKTQYCVGDIDACRKAANRVMELADTCGEKHAALSLLIKCYAAENDPLELLNFCSGMLENLGEKINENPSNVSVQLEYQKMKHRLNNLSDEEILSLPDITNEEKEFALMMMSHLIFPLYQMERTGASTLLTCRMVQLTLKYGMCGSSADAFSMAATSFGGISHDIKAAYRLAQLTEKLVRTRLGGITPKNAQVMSIVASGSKWWFEPVSNSLEIFVESHKICMRSGEVGLGFQSIIAYMTNYYYTGLPLESLLEDTEKYARLFLDYNHKTHFLLTLPLWQCLLNLTGRSDDPLDMMNGEAMLRRQSMGRSAETGMQSAQSFQMQLAFYLGDLPKATELAAIVSGFKAGMMKCTHWYYARRFFFSLISISNYRHTRHRKDKIEAEKHLKIFRTVVKAGAINLVHKLQLLEAEMLPLVRHSFTKVSESDSQTLKLYDDAIVSATRAGFLQDAALANYLCFQFIQTHKVRPHLAEMYIKKSFELWMAWGAVAVAQSLADRHKDMFSAESVRSSLSSSRNSKTGSYRSRPRFDPTLSEQHREIHLIDE